MPEPQPLNIPTGLGLSMAAVYHEPAAAGLRPFVVLLHGFMGWKEEEHLVTLASSLAAAGIGALRFDAPGSGESDGAWAVHYRTSNYVAATHDVLAYAIAHLRADPRRLGLWGHSMGGLVAITAAATLPDLAALCCCQGSSGNVHISPERLTAWQHTGWRTMNTENFGVVKLPITYYDDRNHFDALASLKQIHAPSLFIAGTHDQLVPASSVHKLFAAASESKQYLEYPTDHFFKRDPAMLAKINEATVNFFTAYLTPTSA